MGTPDEELVVEQVAQPRQRMTYSRLAETQLARNGRRLSAAQEAPEDQKQPAVEAPDIVDIDITHESNSIKEFRAPD